jgi:hypothetical protein
MNGSEPKIVQACRSLAAQYRYEPWYMGVGEDGTAIHFYLKKKPHIQLPEEHEGFRVIKTIVGQVRLASVHQ